MNQALGRNRATKIIVEANFWMNPRVNFAKRARDHGRHRPRASTATAMPQTIAEQAFADREHPAHSRAAELPCSADRPRRCRRDPVSSGARDVQQLAGLDRTRRRSALRSTISAITTRGSSPGAIVAGDVPERLTRLDDDLLGGRVVLLAGRHGRVGTSVNAPKASATRDQQHDDAATAGQPDRPEAAGLG